MEKETNFFSDIGKVIFSIGNRKQSESNTEGLNRTILETGTKIYAK